LEATNTASGDAFGGSVAVSGLSAVIGAQGHSGGGAAYVFTKSGSTWHQQAALKGSDTVAGDAFGSSVAISGSIIVVGAPKHRGNGVTGAAYIFTRSGTSWTQSLEVHAANAGISVAADATTVAIASANSSGTGHGSVAIYVQTGSSWTHQATVRSGVLNDGFGTSIGLSGNLLAVGANAGGEAIGHVYVYDRSGSAWTHQATLKGNGVGPTDDFAQSLALSSTTIVVGAPLHADSKGAMYVFVQGSSGWSQQAKLAEGSPIAGDMFGWSVGISGNEAIAGAYQRGGTGVAFTFLRTGTTWTPDRNDAASGSSIGDEVGWSVAQSVSTSIVGAQSTSNDAGAAYVFSG
jgi:hypothetical protein